MKNKKRGKTFNYTILLTSVLLASAVIQSCDSDDVIIEDGNYFQEQTKTTTIIASEGGIIELGSGVRVEIPSNALGSNQDISVTSIDPFKQEINQFPVDTISGIKISPVIRCQPDGISFSKPVKVTIPYFDELIPEELTIKDMVAVSKSGTKTDTIKDFEIDSNVKTISFYTNHFTDFYVTNRKGFWYILDEFLGQNADNYLTLSFKTKRGTNIWNYALQLNKSANNSGKIEQDVAYSIELFRKKSFGDDFIAGKQLFKMFVITGGKHSKSYSISKGVNADKEDIYGHSNLPRASAREDIFNVEAVSRRETKVAALNIVSFNGDKQLESSRFIALGDDFPGKFFNSATDDGSNFSVPIVNINELIAGEKYYFRFEIRGHGDIFSDRMASVGYLISTTFTVDDIGELLDKNHPPVLTIIKPGNNSTYQENEDIVFSCNASDPEDGQLDQEQVIWHSDIDGIFGSGISFKYSDLSLGNHTISVTAIDVAGADTKREIKITIEEATGNAPTANFTASKTIVSIDEVIQFNDASTNNPTDWDWDFGDGNTSDQQNPFHYYSIAGNYTVSLTVTNSIGSDTETKANYITVNSDGSPPVADFIASKSPVDVGEEVEFTDLSTNSPTGWSWEFGDGGISLIQHPKHTYSNAGTYSVSLTASNSYGSNTKTQDIIVSEGGTGDDIVFNPNLTYGTMSDIDGNTYKTIQIGSQTWMAENLKTTHYADGSQIQLLESNASWDHGSRGRGYCWYENSDSNSKIYGALYTWSAAVNGSSSSDQNPSGVQGVCPANWHLPSDAEWQQLEIYLGMSQSSVNTIGNRGNGIGDMLKEAGFVHWKDPNKNKDADNASGFTAIPAGTRDEMGNFSGIGIRGFWWSCSVGDFNYAWKRRLDYHLTSVERSYYKKDVGYSVRCIMD